ncbi:magnesium chelatase domain-containing protein [Streptomyces sp. NBC_01334]|uniref:magnesium chelatase domain-containing protein n=1 Tax=Streptomyces sp. NBC_01334 TaxID=2903827 RepID=UPI003FA3B30C
MDLSRVRARRSPPPSTSPATSRANLAEADRPSFALRDRGRAAILNTGYDWPQGELTVDLLGADEPSSVADPAIACAILAAADHVDPAALRRTVLLGELGLDGRGRVTDQTLAGVRFADLCGYKRVIVSSTAATTMPASKGDPTDPDVQLGQQRPHPRRWGLICTESEIGSRRGFWSCRVGSVTEAE